MKNPLVNRRIRDLTTRQQELIELRCGDRELTNEEAAQVLGNCAHTNKNLATIIIRSLGVHSFNGVCRQYGEENALARLNQGFKADQV